MAEAKAAAKAEDKVEEDPFADYPSPKHLEGCPESRPGAIEHRVREFTDSKGPRIRVKITRCRECGEAARSKWEKVED
jgi:hypothetical protein